MFLSRGALGADFVSGMHCAARVEARALGQGLLLPAVLGLLLRARGLGLRLPVHSMHSQVEAGLWLSTLEGSLAQLF